MDETVGLCRGCLRTLDEIARWSSMSEQDKMQVWRQIRLREAQIEGAAGSSGGRQPPDA